MMWCWLIASLIAINVHGAPGQARELSANIADAEGTWAVVVSNGASVRWEGEEVVFSPAGGFAGIAIPLTPPPTGIIATEFTAAPSRESEVVVGFTHDQHAVLENFACVTALPEVKAHRVGILLAPPLPGDRPLFLQLGVRGEATVAVRDLRLTEEPLGSPPETSAFQAPLPDDWRPNGTLDAQVREIAGATELFVEVNGIQFSIMPKAECPLGGFPNFSALVAGRGTTPRTLRIAGEFPAGVICDERAYPITKSELSKAPLRLQGLLPGDHVGRLIVSSGGESASLPVTLTVGPSYPAFGISPSPAPAQQRWQLQEIRVETGPDSSLDDLLTQLQPHLSGPPTLRVLYFDGLPSPDILRSLVTRLKGQVQLYGSAWRANRPFAGTNPQAEAETLVANAQQLFKIVSTTDLDAYCVSPVFDSSVLVRGSPENLLLEACLELALGKFINCIVFASPPLPAGAVLGESINGHNRREGNAFWTSLDTRHYPYEIERLMDEYDAHVPLLTSSISGPPSVDERLDGLKVAKAMAIAAFVGATGATFPEAASASISLIRADGSLSAVGLVVRELSRELAGAVPVRRTWEGGQIPGNFGSDIVALPFIRPSANEAILVLWNNTSITRPLTLTLRQVPFSEHTLTLSASDPVVERTYRGHFTFSPEAQKVRRQEVYLRLAPLQVKVLRYRMNIALPTWLEAMVFTPPRKGGPPRIEHDDRPWWKKLQDWSEGKD